MKALHNLGFKGHRLIAFAYRDLQAEEIENTQTDLEKNLNFFCLASF